MGNKINKILLLYYNILFIPSDGNTKNRKEFNQLYVDYIFNIDCNY